MQTLPIEIVVPELLEQLKHHSRLVLMAPPGAGKSTFLPLEILKQADELTGQIWMLEPRRLAAEQVARRLAHSLNEPLGKTIGLITGETSQTSNNNKLVIMTEGVLTQKLLNENDIPQCGLVIFDEFHERNLPTDLGLALTMQCQDYLRDDLKMLVMSATLDVSELCEHLEAPLIKSEGRSYPVDIHYRPIAAKQQALFRPVEMAAVQAIRHALNSHQGDVLVFLPGISEIRYVHQQLDDLPDYIDVLPLHGQLKADEQKQVMRNSGQRKVILATDIAKTSLTFEKVTVVIDSGLERIAQFNVKTGMDELITVTASQASSIQRAGRAGRVQAGTCYRLFSEEHFQTRPKFTRVAIELEDLAPLTLALASWGSMDLDDYFFLDRPDPNRYESSQALLQQLDILEDQTITEHGQQLSRLPLHPRLAHMIHQAKAFQLEVTACYLAALLSEGDPLKFDDGHADLSVRLELFSLDNIPATFAHGQVKKALAKRIHEKAKRLCQLVQAPAHQALDFHQCGLLTMLAYPDRIAQQRGQGYRMRNGKGCQLHARDGLTPTPYLAIAYLTHQTSQQTSTSTIRLAAPVTKEEIERLYKPQFTTHQALDGSEQLSVIESLKLGELVLSQTNKTASPELKLAATLQKFKEEGLSALSPNEQDEKLLARLTLGHELWPDIIPNYSDTTLIQEVEDWLSPFLLPNQPLNLSQALLSRLSWDVQGNLNQWLPTEMTLPSGRHAAIDYLQGKPIVRCKLQECFGLAHSPTIAQGKVTLELHLLSPAQRPLAQTSDLAFFWKDVYPEVRKENRGRYAKHPWPEDPLTAIASTQTKKKLEARS